jgi:ferredoxin
MECRGLFGYEIDAEACKGCGIGAKNCPVQAIPGERILRGERGADGARACEQGYDQ